MTAERVRELFSYDPETGVFVWRVTLGNAAVAGTTAGTIYKNGRRYITVEGQRYFAHRLAWLYVNGQWPTAQIDHRNRVRDDNRIANLREATNQQNCANRDVLKRNSLGVKGVVAYRGRKANTPIRYRARIRVNDRLIHLGYYPTPKAAATRYFGEFAQA
jgi:hypothetical protein